MRMCMDDPTGNLLWIPPCSHKCHGERMLFFTLHCSNSLICMNEYLGVDRVDISTSSHDALISAWIFPREVVWFTRLIREV